MQTKIFNVKVELDSLPSSELVKLLEQKEMLHLISWVDIQASQMVSNEAEIGPETGSNIRSRL